MAKKKQKTLRKKSTAAKTAVDYWPWILAALAFLLYANTFGHQYAFDDAIVITQNSFTQQGLAGIPDLLTRDFFEGIYGEKGMDLSGGRYRPLSLLTFAVEYAFFGPAPGISHFINALLYGLTALLLFRVLEQWFGKGKSIALSTTLLFVVHPVHTEVVANIKSRDELLGLLFLLLALQQLFYALQPKQRWRAGLLGSLFFFLALLAKENTFTYIALFPFLLLALRPKTTWKESLQASWPLWATAFGYLLLRTALVGGIGSETNPSLLENPFGQSALGERIATVAYILLLYLKLLFFPHPLSSDYSYPQIPFQDFSQPLVLLSLLLHLGLLGYAAVRIWKRDLWAIAIVMYLAPLLLVSNLLFNIGAPMGERFLYLPSLGFALALGLAIQRLAKVPKRKQLFKKPALVGGLLILSLAASAKTILRNPAWENNVTLFTADMKNSPNSAKMQYYYANSLLKDYMANPIPAKKPLLVKAEAAFQRSAELYPDFHLATYNLGLVKEQQGDYQAALRYLDQTLAKQPMHVQSHSLKGKIFGQYLQRLDSATIYLERVVKEFQQRDASNLQFLGITYAMQGRLQEAQQMLQASAQADPNNAQTQLNLSQVYRQLGNTAKAEQHYRRAVQLNPSLAQ